MNEPRSDPPGETAAGEPHTGSSSQPNDPPPTPEDSEMGGEAACQLHRWWDGDEEADR
ncbi:MAG TPA: hypothetical protein VFS20_25925 [Longimicrobium sp.]|nr:hypothetical protein [Longimicrobium sp.]